MKKQALMWGIFIIFSRLIPHPANVTPLISLSVLSGLYLEQKNSVLIILISLFISDGLLSCIKGCAILGSWTVFTYSAVFIITFFSKYLFKQTSKRSVFIAIFFSTQFFWVWTNLGTWLFSGIYSHTWPGLMRCYFAALPFLKHATLSNVIVGLVFIHGAAFLFKKPQKKRINNFLTLTR